MRLAGKTCLVTGADRGIGKAIAATFADNGANVIVSDINQALGEATAKEIGAPFFRLDVANEADWAAFATQVPSIDVAVSNAGVTGFEGPFEGNPVA